MANPTNPPVGDPSSKWSAVNATLTVTGNSTIVAKTGAYSSFIAVLIVTGTPAGTSPSMTMRFQTLLPDNTTWQDIAAFTAVTAAATRVMAWVSGGSSEFAQAAGSLTAGTFKVMPMGSQMRAQYTISGTSPSFVTTLDVEFFV